MELNGDQFTYQPGFSPTSKSKPAKDKPQRQRGDQQGTLFRVNPSQRTPESRQPRGFSPERWRDVGLATGLLPWRRDEKTGERVISGNGGVRVYHAHAQNTADTLSTIARSTVPMEDLKNLTVHASGETENGSTGVYKRKTAIGPVAETFKGSGQSTTPIHEIGHHVDTEAGTIRNGNAASLADNGRDEGFADNYASKHARLPGYKRKPAEVPSHPSGWDNQYGMKDNPYGRTQFASGYHQERGTGQYAPLNEDQFADRRASGELPKSHVSGQLPLLHKQPGGRRMNYQTRDYEDAPASWSYNHDLMDRGE